MDHESGRTIAIQYGWQSKRVVTTYALQLGRLSFVDNLVDKFQRLPRVQCRGFESHRGYSFFLGVSCVSLLCLCALRPRMQYKDRQGHIETKCFGQTCSCSDRHGFSTFPPVVVGGSCRSLWRTSGEWEGLGATGATDDRAPSLSSTTE